MVDTCCRGVWLRMRRFLGIAGMVVLGFSLGLVYRAVHLQSMQPAVAPASSIPLPESELVHRLARVIRIPTVSTAGAPPTAEVLARLHRLLETLFPEVHRRLQVVTIADGSRVYIWPGTRGDRPPILLMAHMDVVPVDPSTRARWTYAPFSGAVAKGAVWGRGTLDDKSSMVALFEAVAWLLRRGYRPARTVILAFGHDEEVGGRRGAARIARWLAQKGIRPAWVLDEGLAVVRGMIPGIRRPVALVGVAEKGYLSVELRVTGSGGHSSMPPEHTTIGILARAITRLESRPLPARLREPVRSMFRFLAPETHGLVRFVMANFDLFKPAVVWQLKRRQATRAIVQTTMAVTVFHAGVKDNVIPGTARAVVNFRILPGDTVETVLQHVRRVVDDPRVAIRPLEGASEPSPIARVEGPGFRTLQETIRAVFSDTIVAPGLVVGGTDSRHYVGLTPDIYRFVPIVIQPDDVARVHGVNERIRIPDYVRMVRFYITLIRRATRRAS